MPLKNKTVFISGAARRIGRSLSLAVAKAGADLIIHHNTSTQDAITLKQEVEELGQNALIVQGDFSDPQNTQSIAESIFNRNKVYGLINNASIFEDLIFEDTSLIDWQHHISVNLTSPFLLSQSFAKSLAKTDNGRIINILDWRSLRPGTDHFPYTISKAGLASLTKSLAASLAPGISVNGIALGAVMPPSDGGDIEDITDNLPNPRWAKIQEIEDTALFLLTGPEYITGEIIHVDGGRHLV